MAGLSFEAVAFAGGGNRCYWQSGVWQALEEAGIAPPRFIVGVSAGAYHAVINMAGIARETCERAEAFCPPDARNIAWGRLREGRNPLVVGGLFEDLLTQVLDEAALARLKTAPEVLIQVSHPPRFMPAVVATLAGIGAYQIEKALTGAAHSHAGRHVGFTPDWVSTHVVQTPAELVKALLASAAVPPFMPVGRVNGRAALDGGLVDNPPIDRLEAVERAGGRTLVLATRAGKTLPETAQRAVLGPSEPLTLSKFAVNQGAAMRAARELGLRDGRAFAARATLAPRALGA